MRKVISDKLSDQVQVCFVLNEWLVSIQNVDILSMTDFWKLKVFSHPDSKGSPFLTNVPKKTDKVGTKWIPFISIVL